jgi:hypothetical protein
MGPSRNRSTVRPNRFVPQVRALEDRCCPNAAIAVHGHSMLINGGADGSTVRVTDDGHGAVTATVRSGAQTVSAQGTSIGRIDIHTAGTGDSVDFRLTGALAHDLALNLGLGAGGDRAGLDFSAGVTGAGLQVYVAGGPGADRVQAAFGTIQNAAVSFQAQLGAGDDTVGVAFQGGIAGRSQVFVGLDGGAGDDRMTFTEQGAISATALADIRLRGGDGNDRFYATAAGELDGRLRLRQDGGRGDDIADTRLTLAAGSHGRLEAVVEGGSGKDSSTLRVTDNSVGAVASLLANLGEPLTLGPGGSLLSNRTTAA